MSFIEQIGRVVTSGGKKRKTIVGETESRRAREPKTVTEKVIVEREELKINDPVGLEGSNELWYVRDVMGDQVLLAKTPVDPEEANPTEVSTVVSRDKITKL